MYTSILLAALSTVAPSADLAAAPSWSTDYYAANKQAATAKKPLAVVLGTGEKGYEKLDRAGKLSDDAKAVLAAKYLCVYVDTASPAGQRLAKAFDMPSGQGIVISDRTGDLQAFRMEGDLAAADMVRYLERYADPERVLRATETNRTSRTSSYEPAPYGATNFVAPSYCPSCSRGR
jgi:hypothetical protein